MSGPSDRLFRYGYKHLEVAEAALRHNLPPELVAAVDWSTLRYEPEIVVDPERETRKDVVLSARLLGSSPEDPPHFFLIEHQTKVERHMAWRPEASPHSTSEQAENLPEYRLGQNKCGKALHEWLQLGLGHLRNSLIIVATLAKERVAAFFDCIGLHVALHTQAFASSPQECQQCACQSAEQQKFVSAAGLRDANG